MSLKTVITTILLLLLIFGCIFIPAGTLNWPIGWLVLSMFYIFIATYMRLLAKHNPQLLEERATIFRKDQEKADKIVLGLLLTCIIIWFVVIGFDIVRFGWSIAMPIWMQIIGGIGATISFYIIYLAFKENTFLSSVVRIQKDRGQYVIKTGVYGYIRHPMYAGTLLLFPSLTLLVASWYGLLMIPFITISLIIRTSFEEKTLISGLNGYVDYMAEVKYRFIPYVW